MAKKSPQKILVVDDVLLNIKILSKTLKEHYSILVATNGADAIELAQQNADINLILLDIMMPDMDGYEVATRLKADPGTMKTPIIFLTAMDKTEDEAKGLKLGAVDYITKPFNKEILKARVKTHLELEEYRTKLERKVADRTEKLSKAVTDLAKAASQIKAGYIEAIFRLTLASEFKDEDTGGHIKRVSYYTKELATAMGMDSEFIDTIHHASPMHDIGKVGIPDSILLKPSSLSSEEWEIMQTHTTIGAKILEGSNSPYLQMACEVALSHHERWDGNGYPNKRKGDAIPLPGRIMNIADQYDALRSKRPYKPGFDHETTYNIITKGDGRTEPAHFDPAVLEAFINSADTFRQIYLDIED